MISHAIKEVTPEYTYVVFSNDSGKTVGQMFPGAPSEAALMVKGAALLPETTAPTLAFLREQRKESINFWRDVALNSGFTWRGYVVDSDAVSRANITGEALAAQMGEPFPAGYSWRMQNNVNVPCSTADVQDMARTLRTFTLSAYIKSWQMKALPSSRGGNCRNTRRSPRTFGRPSDALRR